MLVSLKRLVLVLSLILGFDARAAAQSTEHRTAFLESLPSPTVVSAPSHTLPLASSLLLIQRQVDFHDVHGFCITGNYRRQNPGGFPSFQETKTLFATESRLPVAQIWGARLRVNFFVLTLNTRNIMLGPLVTNDTFDRPRQLRSVDLYGIGVSVPLGRDARWEGSKSVWRSLSRIVHTGDWP
jgi:hypothetical protein